MNLVQIDNSKLAKQENHTGDYKGNYHMVTQGNIGSRNIVKITNEQANNLISIINEKRVEIVNINNSFYRVSEIRKILTEHERDGLC